TTASRVRRSARSSRRARQQSRRPNGRWARPATDTSLHGRGRRNAGHGFVSPFSIDKRWSAKGMAGNFSFDQLKKAVSNGEIDTVLACIVDMQGRLSGKRFLAQYFVDSAHDETHGCN